jgi:hypothetical protein
MRLVFMRFHVLIIALYIKRTFICLSPVMRRPAGLSDPQTHDCLADGDVLKAFRDRVDAAIAAGLDATPTFVFNGRRLRPGERIGGSVYTGGELTQAQFDAAYAAALTASTNAQKALPGSTP